MFLLQYGNETGNADLTVHEHLRSCERESQKSRKKYIYAQDTNEEIVVGSATKIYYAECAAIFSLPRRSDVYST